MKRILMLFAVVLAMAACTGPMGPMGPQGPAGDDGTGIWNVINVDAPSESWALDDSGNFYFTSLEVPEIDDFVFENAIVLCYAVFGDTQQILPLSTPYQDPNGNWIETFDFSFGVGFVEFYMSYSDFEMYQPGDMSFRIVILE